MSYCSTRFGKEEFYFKNKSQLIYVENMLSTLESKLETELVEYENETVDELIYKYIHYTKRSIKTYESDSQFNDVHNMK